MMVRSMTYCRQYLVLWYNGSWCDTHTAVFIANEALSGPKWKEIRVSSSLSTTRQASVFHCEATCTAIIYCSYNSLIPQVVTIISELQASPGRKFDCRYDSLCRSGSFYYRVEAVATFLCLERNELWIPISDRILIFDTGREGRYYSGPYFCADFEKTGIVHSTGSFEVL